MPHEEGKSSRVIDVRMREYDDIDTLDRDGKLCILCVALAPLPLKQPAIQDDRLSCDTQDVARAGDLARSADELDLHSFSSERLR
jgi:hypothetical protein